MITITSHHTNTCFQAWIKCENLLSELHSIQKFLSNKLVKVVDECALICMGTFHALKSGSVNIPNMAVLCVGICEECADVCDGQNGEHFKQCAKICRECSHVLSDFTQAA